MLRIFRLIAILEAISTICLFFVAMPVKYLLKYFMDVPVDIQQGAVRIAGSLHGGFVVIFVIMLIMCTVEYSWRIGRVLKYFFASLVPVLGFWVELDLKKEIEGRK